MGLNICMPIRGKDTVNDDKAEKVVWNLIQLAALKQRFFPFFGYGYRKLVNFPPFLRYDIV